MFCDVWRFSLCWHDNGVFLAWDRVVKLEWRWGAKARTISNVLMRLVPDKEPSDD